jgi:predicted dinucleotide-binding enzyme
MRIGIIGAGMIGSTLAKLWVDAKHEIVLSSRHPDELAPMVKELGPLAAAGTAADAAEFGDLVLLTVPLKAIPALAREIGADIGSKIVLDTGNAYEQRDGDIAREAMRDPRGTAAWAAVHFPASRWVKAFNTVYFKTLAQEAHRSGDPVGIPLASDHPEGIEVASRLVRDAGFGPVIIGDLATGKQFEPGTRVYNTGMGVSELRRAFAKPAPVPFRTEPPTASA